MHRPNLTVITRALVHRVLFDGTRATGVEYSTRRGGTQQVTAGEVILCGGAFNSPQLLQLSGVGDAPPRHGLGIPVVHDLPAVGQHMQDHLEVYVQYACKQPVSLQPQLEAVAATVHRRPVAVPAQGPGRVEPLRGRRVRPQQRRRRLPEPDVPLPADRRALRRFVARRRPWLPGAHRADVLQLARLGADHLHRSEGQAGPAVQLHLHTGGSPRVGRGHSHRPAHLEPTGDGAVQRRRGLTGTECRDRRADPRLGAHRWRDRTCTRRAPAAWDAPTTTASSTR